MDTCVASSLCYIFLFLESGEGLKYNQNISLSVDYLLDFLDSNI